MKTKSILGRILTCFPLLALLSGAAQADSSKSDQEQLSLVFVGDTGTNASNASVYNRSGGR